MPIRINLLAEAQAAEEARLHDPVKQGIWVGGFLVALVILYILKLYANQLISASGFRNQEAQWTGPAGLSAKATAVSNNLSKIHLIDHRIAQLDRLSTNRYLWGTFLNTLQLNMLDDIQLTSIKTVEEYTVNPAIPPRTVDGKTVPGTNAFSVRKIVVTLDGKDWNYAQQSYERYRQCLSTNEYYNRLSERRGFRLANSLGLPSPDGANPNRSFLPFTLECHYTETTNVDTWR